MGLAGFIISLIGLIGLVPIIGWFFIPLNIIAIILGLIAVFSKDKRDKNFGIASLILGSLPILAKIITWLIIIISSMA